MHGIEESLRYRLFYPVMKTETFSLGFRVLVGNRCLRPLSPGVEGPFSTSVMQSTSNRHYSKYNYTRCFLDAIIRSTSLAYCASIWIIFGWCFLFVLLFPMNKCGKMMKCSESYRPCLVAKFKIPKLSHRMRILHA